MITMTTRIACAPGNILRLGALRGLQLAGAASAGPIEERERERSICTWILINRKIQSVYTCVIYIYEQSNKQIADCWIQKFTVRRKSQINTKTHTHKYMHVFTYIYVYIYMWYTHTLPHIHAYIRTYIHAYIRTYVRTYALNSNALVD